MTEREPISGSSRDYGATTAAQPSVGFSEFSPTELYNLSDNVAQNLNSINSGLKSLDRMMKQIGGSNDTVQLRDKIHGTQQSVNSNVSATARDIQRLGVISRRGDKTHKLQVERLTQDFKDVLSIYSNVQKQVTEKMAAHMPRQARARNDPQLMEQQAIADDEEAQLLDNQQAQIRDAQFETNMLLEREAYVNKLQTDVLDVNQIMMDLAAMVQEQGVKVDHIDDIIGAAQSDVERAEEELRKAAEYKRRYRRRMVILSLIGIIIAALIIVWIVKAFK